MALFTAKKLSFFALIASIILVVSINHSSALSEGSNIKQEAVSYWVDNGCNFPPRTFYNSDKLDVCDRPYRVGERLSGLCRFFYEVSKDLCYAASGESEDAQMLEMLDSYILVLDNKRLCHIFLSMDRGGVIPEVNDLTRSWYKKARNIVTTERSCTAVCDSAGMHPLCVAIFVSFEYIRDVQPPLYGDLFRNRDKDDYYDYDYTYDDNEDQPINNDGEADITTTGTSDKLDDISNATLAANLTFDQVNNTGSTTPLYETRLVDGVNETSTAKEDVIEDVFELVDYEDVKDEYGTERTSTTQGVSTTSPLQDVDKMEVKDGNATKGGPTPLQSSTTPTIITNESSPLPGQQNGSFPVYTGNKNKGDTHGHRQGAGLPDLDDLKKEEQMNYYAVLLGCSGLLIATLLYVIYKNKRAIAMLIATGRKEYRSAPRPKKTDGYQRLGQQDIA
ncbi:Hypp7791 [Branchiostoma lanceolatum]|uniref:Hypp7791 protein n=1 Tax=Branchiostoma lanceolatum TaxID=7740 RepID=A0A8J9Z444_BRALA|nr:Hypp7791 [Branchiostoma lanceolatum]